MATTVGPDMPSEAPTIDNVVNASPRHLPFPITIDNSSHLDSSASSQQSPRASPPPNPHFVFPMKPASPSTSSAPSSYSRATGRRPRSVVDLQERPSSSNVNIPRNTRPSALPDFSFNPGLGLSPPDHAFLSPPLSPVSPRTIPAKPAGAGHRRGGSEFVGGKLRDGENITVMSTSPTKSESGFASPTLAPTRGPPRGRGHAHRRSAAISSHDLTAILQPSSPNPSVLRGNSAPSSPNDFERNKQENYAFPETKQVSKEEDMNGSPSIDAVSQSKAPQPDNQPTEEAKPTPRPATRARVGFSDTLEFIPRPLSLVSSDTSSTITARPGGHSVSGSISSIISLTPSTTADRGMVSPPLSRSPSRNANESRPSTAGAVLERSPTETGGEPTGASPRRRNSIPLLVALPEPTGAAAGPTDTSSPIKTPKRWSFFGLDPWSGANSPTRSRPVSSCSSPELPAKLAKSASSSSEHVSLPAATVPVPPTEEADAISKAATKKSKKKKKASKGWAGSILSRKNKPRRKSRRAPTPPPIRGVATDATEEPSPTITPTVLITESEPEPEIDSWEPQTSPSASHDDEASFSMIDLDAALGPFNTPLPRNPEWEAAQRAGGLNKRQLHSAAGMSRFTGPGMHYSHRRTESAPEMPPMNRSGMMRFSSNSTMADVFEEDEEDDEDTSSDDTPTGNAAEARADVSERHSIDIRVTDSDDAASEVVKEANDDATSSRALSRRGSNLSGMSDEDLAPPSMALRSEYSASSLHEEVIFEESPFFEVRSADSGCNVVDGSDSATPSPRRILKTKDLAPVDVSPLHLPTPSLVPVSPYSMSHSSAFPSPRSPMSYDGNRVSTAPSSITEDNFQSLLMGEPGPELRLSSDIPSLTSSNSTMTRESAFVQFPPQPRGQLPYRGERPASFTASAFGRRRSSLASLHRLISTSHGERSKLSMEVSFNEPEKKAKPSKTKRLSRMMQFWKPKEQKEQKEQSS